MNGSPRDRSESDMPLDVEKGQHEEQKDATDITHNTESMESLRIKDLENLLLELDLPQFVSYEKCLPRLLYDSRFTHIPKQDRRNVFLAARRRILDKTTVEKSLECKKAMEDFQRDLESFISNKTITGNSTIEQIHQLFHDTPSWNHAHLDPNKRDYVIKLKLGELKNAYQKSNRDNKRYLESLVKDAIEATECSHGRLSLMELKNSLRQDPHYYDIESCSERHYIILNLLEEHERTKMKHAKKEFSERRGSRSRRVGDTSSYANYRDCAQRTRCKELLHSLIVERVKNPFELPNFIAARDAYLLTDSRLDQVQRVLDLKEQESVFLCCVAHLKKDRLKLLESELCKSTAFGTPDVTFEEVNETMQWNTDKRYQGIPREDLELCFKKWHTQFLNDCKESFEKYLRTCAAVTSQSPDEGTQFDELMTLLSDDTRYKRLDGFPELRESLVKQRLQELRSESSRLFD